VSQISLQQTESVEMMFQVSSSSVRLDPTTPLMSTDTVGSNERCDVMQCFLGLGCDAQGTLVASVSQVAAMHACMSGDGSKSGRSLLTFRSRIMP